MLYTLRYIGDRRYLITYYDSVVLLLVALGWNVGPWGQYTGVLSLRHILCVPFSKGCFPVQLAVATYFFYNAFKDDLGSGDVV